MFYQRPFRALGVDPGSTGCLVYTDTDGTAHVGVRFASKGHKYIADGIRDLFIFTIRSDHFVSFHENVHAMPDDNGHTAFTFGKNTGVALGAILYEGIEVEDVDPRTWQYEFGLGGKQGPPGCTEDQEYRARKRAHKAKAQELCPHIKVTLDMADAILIAIYGWRKLNGVLHHGRKNQKKREGTGLQWIVGPQGERMPALRQVRHST